MSPRLTRVILHLRDSGRLVIALPGWGFQAVPKADAYDRRFEPASGFIVTPHGGKALKRIDALTGIRGLAALWVALFHLQVSDFGAWLHLSPVVAHGAWGVDIFFVLSGMILSLVYCPQMPATISRRWFGRFLLRRIAKIYPLHLLTLLATIGLVVLAAFRHYHFHATNTDYTAWSAIANFFLLHAFGVTRQMSWNAASWSVSAEWFAYLVLFVPMVRLLRRVPLAWVIALALSLWCGLVLFAAFGLHTTISEITYRGVLRILPEFICGYALYRIIEIAKPRRGDGFWMIGIAGGICLCFFPSLPFLLVPCIGLVLLGLYWGGPLADAVWGNRLAVRIGEASFSIYMQQEFFQIAINQLARRVVIPHTLAAGIALVTVHIALVCAAGVLCFLYVEEPLRQAVIHRFDARSRPAAYMQVAATIS
jgi:peptidoglycan/LPS O-acetylase OafA/YrhL